MVTTNAADKLANWRDSNTLVRSAFRVHGVGNLTDPLRLAWVHRGVAEEAVAAGKLPSGNHCCIKARAASECGPLATVYT